jgi:hypothetical protein
MKEKLLLIAGCSHAAGSEIDGTEDSVYNRHRCFGSNLATRLGRKPINIATAGNNNSGIARSILKWFSSTYNPKKMDVMVLVAWTDSTRLELPLENVKNTPPEPNCANWFDVTSMSFYRTVMGYTGNKDNPDEVQMLEKIQRFIVENERFVEIVSLNYILQIQYFLQSKKVDYLMCNSMPVFDAHTKHLGYYLNLIDATKYYGIYNSEQAFFPKYRKEGYVNPKAKYWHHDEIPHGIFTEELYSFIEENK